MLVKQNVKLNQNWWNGGTDLHYVVTILGIVVQHSAVIFALLIQPTPAMWFNENKLELVEIKTILVGWIKLNIEITFGRAYCTGKHQNYMASRSINTVP